MHPTAINFETIREREARILASKRAPATQVAYTHAWRAFEKWCASAGVSALPAETQAVRDFCTWCLLSKYRLRTVTLRLAAITYYHREAGVDPAFSSSVRHYLAQARRELRETSRAKAALTYDQLVHIVSALPKNDLGLRDRAMLLLAFASGWRRREVVGMEYRDVHFVADGIELWQPYSKTDQVGEGRLVGIQPGTREATCPVRALKAWIERRGDWRGPLFPRFTPAKEITTEPLRPRGDRLYDLVRCGVSQLGEDKTRFGAHSLRAGMITEAAKHGASEASIMQRTGHRDPATLRKYIRPASVFDFNPLRGVL